MRDSGDATMLEFQMKRRGGGGKAVDADLPVFVRTDIRHHTRQSMPDAATA